MTVNKNHVSDAFYRKRKILGTINLYNAAKDINQLSILALLQFLQGKYRESANKEKNFRPFLLEKNSMIFLN